MVCDLVNSKILPGRPVALAEDPNGLVVLAVRPQGTAQEQNYEGLYGVDLIGGTITTFLRHQDHPTDLHFEEAWDTGGNGLTLLGPNVYFTTSPGTGNPSRVYSAPRVQNAKPTIFADGLVRAQDIATDGASLFYVDRGKEDGTAPGFVFQKRAP